MYFLFQRGDLCKYFQPLLSKSTKHFKENIIITSVFTHPNSFFSGIFDLSMELGIANTKLVRQWNFVDIVDPDLELLNPPGN